MLAELGLCAVIWETGKWLSRKAGPEVVAKAATLKDATVDMAKAVKDQVSGVTEARLQEARRKALQGYLAAGGKIEDLTNVKPSDLS